MTNRDDYVEKLKAQLVQWDSQMATWESAARMAKADARIELEKQTGIMRSRVDDLAFRMELLKGASTDAWQDMMKGADQAWKNMHEAFSKARSHFDKK